MGEESNKKRKASLVLDWDKLLDKQDDDPPEIVVTTNISSDMTQSAMGNGESNHHDCESLSDVELDELIARKKRSYQSTAPKLPDKGKKLSDSITMLEQEKERRSKNHPKLKDDNGSEMSTHFESSSVMSTSAGFKQVPPPSSGPRSQFSSLFCQKVEENQANRKCGASDYQSNVLGRCDVRKTRLNSQVSLEERCRSGLTSRQTAFQSPTCLSGGAEKENASNGDTYPSHSSLILIKDPSGCSSRNIFKVSPSNKFRPTNVEAVVVVDEEEQHVDNIDEEEKLDESMKENRIYFPSRDHPESVEICYADMECLAPETYLSSTIMNFYIRYLQQPTSTVVKDRFRLCSYHFFNTYFYEKLKECVHNKTKDMEKVYAKFRRWWKGVNIFEKAYIFLPIHENQHWSLIIICIPDKKDECGPILLHLDSLGYHSSTLIFENIKRFLQKEWAYLKEKETSTNYHIADRIWKNLPRRIEEKVIMVPQQKNDYDCGLFVLFFIQRFIEEAPERLKKKDLTMFGKKWFNPKEASDLRREIRSLLKKMFVDNRGDKSID